MKHIFVSILIFALCFTTLTVLLLPTFLLVILGGFIAGSYFEGKVYGFFIALVIILHINILAAFAALSNSKLCLKDLVRTHIINKNKKLRNIDRVLKVYGLKAVFFLRLSPLVPSYILNYILGSFDSILNIHYIFELIYSKQ